MSDLSDLMQIAPATGAYFIGQNQGNQVAMDQLRQQELAQIVQKMQQEYDFNTQNNPLRLQNQDLTNQGLQAGLPGIAAESQIRQQTAAKGAATLQSDIAAANSNNQNTVSENQYKNVVRARDTMLQAGPMLDAIPAPLRAGAFVAHLQNSGVNINSPDIQQIIQMAQQNPNNFPNYIKNIAQGLGQQALAMDPKAQAEMAAARTHAGAEIEAARIHASATENAARITSSGRIQVAQARQKAAEDLSGLSPDKAAVKASANADKADKVYQITKDPEDAENAQFWHNQAAKYEQLAYNLANARGAGGIGLGQKPDGSIGLTPKVVNPVLNNNAPLMPQGTTSSGVRFRVVPNQ